MYDKKTLFDKYISGKCTRAELRVLLDHFRDQEPDMVLVNEIEALLQEQETEDQDLLHVQGLLLENHLRIKQRIKSPTMHRGFFMRFYPYAAAVLIFVTIAAGIYGYYTQQNSSLLTSQYGADALPGGNKATLTLADGSIIPLSEDQEGIVIDAHNLRYDDGTSIAAVDPKENVATISYATLSTPNGGQYKVTLPDGTKVRLNAASTLRYPTVFTGEERLVELTGEAYFEVAHMPENPFKVTVNGTQVEVLGTTFNINSYDASATTTLVTGSVKVSNGVRRHTLRPGQESYFDGRQIVVREADVTKTTAWKDGRFYFRKDNIVVIMEQLSRWYDLEVNYKGKVPLHTGYSGHISRDVNLSEVLEMLSFVSEADFEVKGGRKINVIFK